MLLTLAPPFPRPLPPFPRPDMFAKLIEGGGSGERSCVCVSVCGKEIEMEELLRGLLILS